MTDPGTPDLVGETIARRYSGELTQALRQEVKAVLLQASIHDGNPPRWSRRAAAGLVVAIAIGGAWAMNGREEGRAVRSSVAFSSLNDVRGGRVRAEEMLPVREATVRAGETKLSGREQKVPAPAGKAAKTTPPVAAPPRRAATTGEVPGAERCLNCARDRPAEWETVFDASRDEPLVVPAAEVPRKTVVNVGTRIPVTLLEPIVTGGGGAPARGRVEQDMRSEQGMALPRGAVFVGQAFATDTDDRVQILFAWLVMGGKSHPVRALVLGPDNGLGLKGRVVQRASRARGLGGTVLGTVGRVLSFGLLTGGGTDLGSLAARDAAETVGDSLRSTGQRWIVSDKVIHLPEGMNAVAYLEGDLELE